MDCSSSTVLTLVVVVLCFSLSIDAHGSLTSPKGRGIVAGNPQYVEDAPVLKPRPTQPAPAPDPVGDLEFICRNSPVIPVAQRQNIVAGVSNTIRWDFGAAHVGDCYLYLTYDVDLADTAKKWFKIAEYGSCKDNSGQLMSFVIPSSLPPANHAILRWEWTAHHTYPNIELYAQCVDIVISSQGNVMPTSTYMVNIPGHIPYDSSFYRNEFAGETWPVKKLGPVLYNGTAVSPPTTGTPPTSTGNPTVTPPTSTGSTPTLTPPASTGGTPPTPTSNNNLGSSDPNSSNGSGGGGGAGWVAFGILLAIVILSIIVLVFLVKSGKLIISTPEENF